MKLEVQFGSGEIFLVHDHGMAEIIREILCSAATTTITEPASRWRSMERPERNQDHMIELNAHWDSVKAHFNAGGSKADAPSLIPKNPPALVPPELVDPPVEVNPLQDGSQDPPKTEPKPEPKKKKTKGRGRRR